MNSGASKRRITSYSSLEKEEEKSTSLTFRVLVLDESRDFRFSNGPEYTTEIWQGRFVPVGRKYRATVVKKAIRGIRKMRKIELV